MHNMKPSRLADRSSHDLSRVKEALNGSLFCTVSYSVDNQAFSIPTGFALVDDRIIIHGSVKSQFLTAMPKDQEICITACIFDALVLAKSAFDHSVNYRSAVVFAKAVEITDYDEKVEALKAFTERYLPGRWDHLRPVKEGEIHATTVFSFDLEKSSAKERTGPPTFNRAEKDLDIWTGIIPVYNLYGVPLVSPDVSVSQKLPDHLKRFK